jgi:hypothetical protein
MHGCGMSAEQYAEDFAPYAAENDVVMVFPQSIVCFDNFASDYTRPNR